MGKRKKKGNSGTEEMDFSLSPETKQGISIVILVLLSVILFLALVGLAGPLGKFLDDALSSFFGISRALVAVVFSLWAYHIIYPEKGLFRPMSVLGVALLFFALNGLLHAGLIDRVQTLEKAGGALGLLSYEALSFVVGSIAGVIVLVACFGISLMILANFSITSLIRAMNGLFASAAPKTTRPKIITGDDDEDEEECVPEEKEERAEVKREEPKINEPVASETELEEEAPAMTLTAAKQEVLLRPKERRSIAIPLDLLDGTPSKPTSGDIEANMDMIQRTLKNFGVPVEMGDVNVGPTVTQYSFKPADGVKLTKITGLKNDLSLALAAHPLRIEAPIPGKSLVGIEVPNKSIATVRLRDIIASKPFDTGRSPLTFALGKDVAGKPWVAELDKMPHLLVAGQTGSGKSVCLNTLLISLMYKVGPDDLKFILVDPKRVELSLYNGIPYLLTPVITDVQKTVNALKWAVGEMERRYEKLQAFGARDIKSYNEKAEDGMPYLVIVIDELADLMVSAAQEVEGSVVRLAQMARAVGIHLVLATQRPSVNVITGLIKANIPGRIAFAVASSIDSRTILDAVGAESLLGRGDMLLSTAEMGSPKRLQGCFVGEEEVRRVATFLKNTCEAPEYDTAVVERQKRSGTVFADSGSIDGGDDDGDPLMEEAVNVIMQSGKASASLLQRRLKVGYSRAARLLDIMEERGVIGPADGAKPRDILMKGGAAVPASNPSESNNSGASDENAM